ncbi:hypothetical protein PPL_05647 [Heterostelium album PN500]|uniref:Uncharacterized protein n=1 Tax=Heterostelium pallidum (strain ATCC 26659 / Pp 5 / PN500) TaxID=670386 RepID=D3BAR6_HETP5|nr:hypothetical protein PPL_05647 [Heterostelium album PN500]EFA81653.1 hypothetical protein PPL_05647 [Heterostelium album PN500]|eukprot:XP_020433770.1 hypothetical protein PPL_05647 [Heterostelium album PN500]
MEKVTMKIINAAKALLERQSAELRKKAQELTLENN